MYFGATLRGGAGVCSISSGRTFSSRGARSDVGHGEALTWRPVRIDPGASLGGFGGSEGRKGSLAGSRGGGGGALARAPLRGGSGDAIRSGGVR
jgi:hypothetical protein